MPHFYIVDNDDNLREVTSPIEWTVWRLSHDPRIMVSGLLDEGCEVSTVFLGRADVPSDPPLVYETMVFGGILDGLTVQYASHAEAIDGHLKAIEAVKELTAKLAATGETFLATVE